MTTALEQLMTIEQLSDVLQVPVRTLRFWRQNGEGPPVKKIGSGLRYSPSEVKAWVDAQTATPKPRKRGRS